MRVGCAVLTTAAIACVAGSAHGQTLDAAIEQAYSGNPTLKAARAALRAVDERYGQARAGYAPQVNGTLGATEEGVNGKYYGGSRGALAVSGSLTLTQPLYTNGRVRAAVSAAEAEILQQAEVLRRTEQETLATVIAAYAAVRRDEQLLAAFRDNREALSRQLKQTNAEFGVRRVTRTDVDQVTSRLELANADLATAQSQVEISRSLYAQLVGSPAGALAPEPDLAVFPTLDAAFAAADAGNPQVQAARYGEQAARARVMQARAAFGPSVSAQANLSRSPVDAYSTVLGDQTILAAGVVVSQPLYAGGLLRSSVRQAKASADQAEAQVDAARLVALQQLSEAWSRLTAARLSLEADERRVSATEKVFYGVRREQPFDLRQPIDVLNAEQELNNAQARLITDRYAEYVARVNLQLAAGFVAARELPASASAVQPGAKAHLEAVRAHAGGLPWIKAVAAIDQVGGPAETKPSSSSPTPAAPAGGDALPSAPPAAATRGPLRTATSIIDAETSDAQKARQP